MGRSPSAGGSSSGSSASPSSPCPLSPSPPSPPPPSPPSLVSWGQYQIIVVMKKQYNPSKSRCQQLTIYLDHYSSQSFSPKNDKHQKRTKLSPSFPKKRVCVTETEDLNGFVSKLNTLQFTSLSYCYYIIPPQNTDVHTSGVSGVVLFVPFVVALDEGFGLGRGWDLILLMR